MGLISQSTATVIHPLEELELVASTNSLVLATPAESAYKATSKFAVFVPEPRYQPIWVILMALAGLVCFVTTDEPSMVVLDPAGSAVGEVETKPEFIPNWSAID